MAGFPRHLVLDVEWPPDADGHRRELLGPWAEAEDDSHLEEILRLIRSLDARPGPHPKTVTLILLTSPAEWLAAGGGGAEPPRVRLPGMRQAGRLARLLPGARSFGEWARKICESTGKARLARGRTWDWRVGGAIKPQLLAVALYGDATVYLDRKHLLATELAAARFPGKHLFGSPG